MSRASTGRKLQRQRIHGRNLALAQTLAEKQRGRWEVAGAARGVREERERRTILLDPHEDDHLLTPRPEHDVKLVALMPSMTLDFATYREHANRYFPSPHVVRFQAVRKTWKAGTGQTVTWWDWEFKG